MPAAQDVLLGLGRAIDQPKTSLPGEKRLATARALEAMLFDLQS